MAQDTNRDVDRPSRNMEPAEGSRETVLDNQNEGGITNRPLDREQQEQHELPPRGRSKSESREDADSQSER